MICPCCGRPFVLSLKVGGQAAEDDRDVAQVASDLGIELGALKGGEEIGD